MIRSNVHVACLDKTRPVLLLTREEVRAVRPFVTVAPITSTVRGLRSEGHPRGIRSGRVRTWCGRPDADPCRAVAPGSIATARYEEYWREHPDTDQQLAALHPGIPPTAAGGNG